MAQRLKVGYVVTATHTLSDYMIYVGGKCLSSSSGALNTVWIGS